MTLENPQNIILKLNNIQDNIEYLNREAKTLIDPSEVQNSIFNESNNDYLRSNLCNYSNNDVNGINNNNLFQNNSTSQTFSNINANSTNIKNALNSFDNIRFKTIYETHFNFDFLNNNPISNQSPNNKFNVNSLNLSNNKNKLFINKSLSDKKNSKKKNKEKDKEKDKDRYKVKPKKSKLVKKFKISHIEIKNKNIISKLKNKRKYKPDDIRKKIKSRFHKSIKNIINDNLKKAGSKYLFSFFPQVFISSIARESNHRILNLTYRELLEKDFIEEIDEKKYKNKKVDLSKYINNLRVLQYLDKNPDICKASGFDIISNMKYSDLLKEYFISDEFDNSINKLRKENEDEYYINEYINKAKNYVNFFSVLPPLKIKGNKISKNEIERKMEITNKKK